MDMTHVLKREDFENDTEVRWCPGCGDYAILAAIQKMLPELGLPPHNHVFISGIGCAGRLPYYINAYGFHTIHGRATAVATGLSAMRPDLKIWVVTGDGDALSIGGNHLLHVLRRNVNITILLVNNEIYGLTKGQFSPTSQRGQLTKTSLDGVSTEPVNPLLFALSAGATFVARAVDKSPQELGNILKKAAEHTGASFVEIYQDCNIFNHGAFDQFSVKNERKKHTISLSSNEPLTYSDNEETWCLQQEGDTFSKVELKNVSHPTLHDPSNRISAMRLASLRFPEYPVPLGVFYQKEASSFSLRGDVNKGEADLEALFREKASWSEA